MQKCTPEHAICLAHNYFKDVDYIDRLFHSVGYMTFFAAQLSQRQVPSLIVHPHCASPGGLFGNE